MDRSSTKPNRFTTEKINDKIFLLVWLDRMHILNRMTPIKSDRIMSALFTIGNQLNGNRNYQVTLDQSSPNIMLHK